MCTVYFLRALGGAVITMQNIRKHSEIYTEMLMRIEHQLRIIAFVKLVN